MTPVQAVMEIEKADSAPLSKAEIRDTFVGNSVYKAPDPAEWFSLFVPDGMTIGESWWNGGSCYAEGTWHVSDDGLLCTHWESNWGGNQENCFRVYRNGNQLTHVRMRSDMNREAVVTLELRDGKPAVF